MKVERVLMLVLLAGCLIGCPEEDPCRACMQDGKCRLCSDSFLNTEMSCSKAPYVDHCNVYSKGESNNKCEKCDFGYQLEGKECVACSPGCGSCPVKGKCAACFGGFKPDPKGEKCVKENGICSVENCDVCDSTGTCLLCKENFAIDMNSICVEAPSNCMFTNNPEKCDECKNGFYLRFDRTCSPTWMRLKPKYIWFSFWVIMFLIIGSIIFCLRKSSGLTTSPLLESLATENHKNGPINPQQASSNPQN